MTSARPTVTASLARVLPLFFLIGCDDTVSIVGRRTRDATVGDDTPDVIPPQDGADVTAPPDATADVPPGMDVAVDRVTPDAPDAPDAPPPAHVPRVVVNCGAVCVRPLDAVPDSMGRNVYFTAFTTARVPAVFRAAIPAPGAMPATPTLLIAGMGLTFPSGIALSHDDATLYIADMAADRGTDDASLGLGAVFSMAAAGGTPTIVNLGTALVHPSAVALSSDGVNVLVSAQVLDAMGDRSHAVFRSPRAGGAATVVAMGLSGPSGLSQAAGGAVVVFDLRRTGPNAGAALTVGAGSPTLVTGDLVASYPAGLAHTLDGRGILVSAASPAVGPGLLTAIGADGRPSAPATLSQGMVAPLGLHRARLADVWTVADETAGDTGQVFLLNGPL